jgi:hypothetical protein
VFSLTIRNLPSRIGLLLGRSEHNTDYQDLGHSSGSLEAEYQRLVAHHLARWGVPERHVSVDIQQAGVEHGKAVFNAVICLLQWDRNSVLRVLVGLPLLERKIRQSMAGLWLMDVSILRSVLVRASEAIQQPAPCAELRQTLVNLTGGRHNDKTAAGRKHGTDVTCS